MVGRVGSGWGLMREIGIQKFWLYARSIGIQDCIRLQLDETKDEGLEWIQIRARWDEGEWVNSGWNRGWFG